MTKLTSRIVKMKKVRTDVLLLNSKNIYVSIKLIILLFKKMVLINVCLTNQFLQFFLLN